MIDVRVKSEKYFRELNLSKTSVVSATCTCELSLIIPSDSTCTVEVCSFEKDARGQ